VNDEVSGGAGFIEIPESLAGYLLDGSKVLFFFLPDDHQAINELMV
jgi:hypothetical protein